MLIQSDLASLATPPTKVVGAGEPLNPEVIAQVEKAWGVTIRDGFGQTETTVMVSNPPGRQVVPGAMGVPLPGYPVVLVDPATGERLDSPEAEGEICIDLADRPVGLMVGYHGDPERDADAMRDGFYTPVTSATGTRRARSPTSDAATTSSRPRTTGSRRSSWRAR